MNEIANQNYRTVAQLLEKNRKGLESVLPTGIAFEKIARLALNEMRRNPKLMEADPVSFIGAVVQASQLGLEIDGRGLAYLVPFYNSYRKCLEVQMITGYKGLINLAMRSGHVIKIEAHEVREADVFEYQYGTNEFLRHVPSTADDPGRVIAAYAVATLRNGGHQFEVLPWREIMAHRAQSKSAESSGSPWNTNQEAMIRKTPIRVLARYLPQCPELQQGVYLDELADRGEQNAREVLEGVFEHTEVPEATPEPETKTDKVAEKVARKAKKKAAKKTAPPDEPQPPADDDQPQEPVNIDDFLPPDYGVEV